MKRTLHECVGFAPHKVQSHLTGMCSLLCSGHLQGLLVILNSPDTSGWNELPPDFDISGRVPSSREAWHRAAAPHHQKESTEVVQASNYIYPGHLCLEVFWALPMTTRTMGQTQNLLESSCILRPGNNLGFLEKLASVTEEGHLGFPPKLVFLTTQPQISCKNWITVNTSVRTEVF